MNCYVYILSVAYHFNEKFSHETDHFLAINERINSAFIFLLVLFSLHCHRVQKLQLNCKDSLFFVESESERERLFHQIDKKKSANRGEK